MKKEKSTRLLSSAKITFIDVQGWVVWSAIDKHVVGFFPARFLADEFVDKLIRTSEPFVVLPAVVSRIEVKE